MDFCNIWVGDDNEWEIAEGLETVGEANGQEGQCEVGGLEEGPG